MEPQEEGSETESEGQTAAPTPAAPAPAATPQPEAARPPTVPFQFEDVAMIARSASTLKSLARQRLSEALEYLDSKLDAAYTAELTTCGLLSLIFAYTRLKPLVRICDLSAFGFDMRL